MQFNRGKKIVISVCVVFLFLLAPVYLGAYNLHLLTFIVFNSVLGISLRFIMLCGSLYLGHTAFMGIGGYITALLVVKLDSPFELALLASAAAAMVLAIILGLIVLRLRGVYFIIVSIALVEIIRLFVTWWSPVTGGTAGVYVPKPTIFGIHLSTPAHLYLFVCILGLITFFVLYKLEESRFGVTLKGIAQAEELAAAVGVNVTNYKVAAFSIGSLIAALCGAFFAFYMQFIAPQYVSFLTAVYILIYCIVGGLSSIWGPIVGAAAMTLLSEPLRGMTYYEMLSYGVILIAIVLLLPNGLISLPSMIPELFKKMSDFMDRSKTLFSIARSRTEKAKK